MLPLKEILLQSGRLLRRHPGLLVPVALVAVAWRLLLGEKSGNVPATVAWLLLNLAMTAGLLTMIRAAHNAEMGGWDAFLIGVGRYFAPILAGSLVQLALVLLTLLPIVAWLRHTVGVPDMGALMSSLKTAEMTVPQAEQVIQWSAALCAWAAVWGIVYFFLALWKQALVSQSLSWLRAWQISASFVKMHWLPMTGLLALQALGLATGFALAALGHAVAAEVGGLAILLLNCYFSVATMVTIMGPAAAPKGENVDAAA